MIWAKLCCSNWGISASVLWTLFFCKCLGNEVEFLQLCILRVVCLVCMCTKKSSPAGKMYLFTWGKNFLQISDQNIRYCINVFQNISNDTNRAIILNYSWNRDSDLLHFTKKNIKIPTRPSVLNFCHVQLVPFTFQAETETGLTAPFSLGSSTRRWYHRAPGLQIQMTPFSIQCRYT